MDLPSADEAREITTKANQKPFNFSCEVYEEIYRIFQIMRYHMEAGYYEAKVIVANKFSQHMDIFTYFFESKGYTFQESIHGLWTTECKISWKSPK